jgi:predicted lipid-binding transport protein (Tim44 family)
MLKGLLGFFAFIFFLVVLILLLVGSYIYRTYRKIRVAAQRAADRQAQQHRDETGRQRQQYSQRQQSSNTNDAGDTSYYDQPRQTTTATGETIIDNRHQERESKKIFDDSDGEYVDFVEEA